jgi:hypothetical protein
VSKISYTAYETLFLKSQAMQEDNPETNDFYTTCMMYFDALRRQGKQDFGFEDEFFYTMPAISEKLVNSK